MHVTALICVHICFLKQARKQISQPFFCSIATSRHLSKNVAHAFLPRKVREIGEEAVKLNCELVGKL